MAYNFSIETVPVYLAMIVVVPLTFDAIKVVLEDKLDFDVIINRSMLRVLEVAIAIMIFPTAAIFSVCLAAFYVVKKSYVAASKLMEFLSAPCFFSFVGYYIGLVAAFLSIQIVIILLLNFVYNSI
ncbi:hypothetical protein PoB_003062600 [Plakobranchus ocellatus]|uniref:Uncharacterized protein n=1 Tax=Plakobranchus ocellatus TaxID=259542 RepID=A0AAV3ZYR8_9GAST|nr:hypothetical protein PoB_003062600 [Plakobranchus ocellatus]